MTTYSRREVIQMGAWLAAGAGLASTHATALAAGIESIIKGKVRVLWMQGQSCSGCSVSLLNTEEPGPLDMVTKMISLVYHSNLSATQGKQAMDTIQSVVDQGNYVLVLEGSIPVGMPEACIIGGKPLSESIEPMIRNADLCIAAGTCSAFGGIPAADGTVTGARTLKEYMDSKGISTNRTLINCPGCPTHPKSILATVAYAASKGYPEVHPEHLTPTMLFSTSVHDDCPRFHYWEKQKFANHFGEPGCLFKLGCLGPHTHTMCPQRQWNGGANWCIRAGAPCVGCTGENFAKDKDFPFYRLGEMETERYNKTTS